MIDSNQMRKGTTYQEEGDIYRVLDYSHNKTARGGATIRVTVRNMRTGSTTQKTYNSGNKIDDIRIEGRTVQYLYEDGEFLTFMDTQTYEQPLIRRDVLGEDFKYVKENMTMKLEFYGDEVIGYEIPASMEYEVIESEMAIAGDRANNPTKDVTVETGLTVQVPMFINVGDVIKVNTDTGEYITRVNN